MKISNGLVECENGNLIFFSTDSSALSAAKGDVLVSMREAKVEASEIRKAARAMKVNANCDVKAVPISEDGGFTAGTLFRQVDAAYSLAVPALYSEFVTAKASAKDWRNGQIDFLKCESKFDPDERVVTLLAREAEETGYKVSAQRVSAGYKPVSTKGPCEPRWEPGLIYFCQSESDYETLRRDNIELHSLLINAEVSEATLKALAPFDETARNFDAKKFAERKRIRKAALTRRLNGDKARELANERFEAEGRNFDAELLAASDALSDVKAEKSDLEQLVNGNAGLGCAALESEYSKEVKALDAGAEFKARVTAQIKEVETREAVASAKVEALKAFLKELRSELSQEKRAEGNRARVAKFDAKMRASLESQGEEAQAAQRAKNATRKADYRARKRQEAASVPTQNVNCKVA